VHDDTTIAFPMTLIVLSPVVVRRDPIRARIGRTRPIPVVPNVVAVFRVLITLNPNVIGSGLGRYAVRARRWRRTNANAERDLRTRRSRECQL
jgi:hypothetical protein